MEEGVGKPTETHSSRLINFLKVSLAELSVEAAGKLS